MARRQLPCPTVLATHGQASRRPRQKECTNLPRSHMRPQAPTCIEGSASTRRLRQKECTNLPHGHMLALPFACVGSVGHAPAAAWRGAGCRHARVPCPARLLGAPRLRAARPCRGIGRPAGNRGWGAAPGIPFCVCMPQGLYSACMRRSCCTAAAEDGDIFVTPVGSLQNTILRPTSGSREGVQQRH